MKETKDILADNKFKQNPYVVREGYFDCIGSRVNDRIDNPTPKSGFWTVAKPAILLACSFLIIFGIGYGTLSLTNTIGGASESNLNNATFADFMENLHNTDSETFNQNGEITDEEMYEFLTEYFSSTYLESYFASVE